ncbi:NTP transferase domain-containing protein [Saccharomonospora azurea]|uniref:NTP transferase domain-containing protein n=1 Tax=Saccharomonospora azurea TaxID=40988 RepID=UPI003D935B3C
MKTDEIVVVIIAGGAGTRMRHLLGDTPKFLAPITPELCFADFVIDRLAELGATRAHLCLGKGADAVLRWTRRRALPIPVTSTLEPRPLGVIGAVRDALPALPERFVMAYGDVWPPLPPAALLRALDDRTCSAMAVSSKEVSAPLLPNVEVRAERIVRYTKDSDPAALTHLDAGMVGFTREALSLGADCRDEVQLFPRLAEAGRMAAVFSEHAPVQVGDQRGYEHARATLPVVTAR